MNSWRLSSVMCPVRVRKSMAANHSSSVSADLGGEGVQVAHERLQDLAQARIGRAVEAGLDGLGQLGVGEVAPLRCLRGWWLGHSSTFARVVRRVKCHCTL